MYVFTVLVVKRRVVKIVTERTHFAVDREIACAINNIPQAIIKWTEVENAKRDNRREGYN